MTAETAWEPLLVDDPEFNREPLPHERSLCCAFLLDPVSAVREWKCRVSGLANPGSMFRDQRHRLLVQKLVKLHTAGVKCFDYTTLHGRCDKSEIESFGGWPYIVQHQEYLLMGASFHVQMDHLIARHRVSEFNKLAAFAAESATDQASLNEAIAMLTSKASSLVHSEAEMLNPTEDAISDALTTLTTEGGDDNRIPTSFRELAKIVGDYPRAEIRLVGAPSGNGKTAFAMQEIEYALQHGFTVDAFLTETNFLQLFERFLLRKTVIPGGRFKRKFFTQDEAGRIFNESEYFAKITKNLHISRPGYFSAVEVDRMIQNRKAATGRPCDLIVIDYLDKMNHPAVKGGEYEAQKHTVHQLHDLAAKENAAMLMLDQLSMDAVRSGFKSRAGWPTYHAFKNGTSTNVSKVVIILHKNEQDMLEGDPVVQQHFVICKANDAPTGVLPSLFLKPFAMHIEDTDFPRGRLAYKAHLDALNYDINTPRKDT